MVHVCLQTQINKSLASLIYVCIFWQFLTYFFWSHIRNQPAIAISLNLSALHSANPQQNLRALDQQKVDRFPTPRPRHAHSLRWSEAPEASFGFCGDCQVTGIGRLHQNPTNAVKTTYWYIHTYTLFLVFSLTNTNYSLFSAMQLLYLIHKTLNRSSILWHHSTIPDTARLVSRSVSSKRNQKKRTSTASPSTWKPNNTCLATRCVFPCWDSSTLTLASYSIPMLGFMTQLQSGSA